MTQIRRLSVVAVQLRLPVCGVHNLNQTLLCVSSLLRFDLGDFLPGLYCCSAECLTPTNGGELSHVDMFAHNKSGIAYRDG
jgi:hypothetical protein